MSDYCDAETHYKAYAAARALPDDAHLARVIEAVLDVAAPRIVARVRAEADAEQNEADECQAQGCPVTPKRPPRKARAIRVEDDLWEAAQRAAESRGEVLSEVIREKLKDYVRSAK